MYIIVENANSGARLFFEKKDNDMFLEVNSIPPEIVNHISDIYTPTNLVEYAQRVYWGHNVVSFYKNSDSFRENSLKIKSDNFIVYVEWDMIDLVSRWITQKIPFGLNN